MWFRNLQIYRFTRPLELTAEQLEAQLEREAFTPCGSQDMSRFGFPAYKLVLNRETNCYTRTNQVLSIGFSKPPPPCSRR